MLLAAFGRLLIFIGFFLAPDNPIIFVRYYNAGFASVKASAKFRKDMKFFLDFLVDNPSL